MSFLDNMKVLGTNGFAVKTRLAVTWDWLRSSFWFVPILMTIGATALSFATVAFDKLLADGWVRSAGWVYAGGAEGASAVLATVAGSMITIAALVFSLTLVALSLTSSQFGPRLLRTFMRDTTNQVVLGTFVATFVYCLLVLRTIRRADEVAFVPHLSVTLGVVFAVVSLAVLIYFIHHVAISIQADETAARVGAELLDNIHRLYPEQIGRDDPKDSEPEIPAEFDAEAQAVPASRDGYVQVIDGDVLLKLAAGNDLVVRVERRPGHYVVAGRPLMRVWPSERLTEELAAQLTEAFVIGNQRTETQDVEYAVNQLVEIAVRALSPGINDPFTAVACVDRIGSALSRLADREIPSPYRRDSHGGLRVIAFPITFEGVTDAALNQIRQYGQSSAAVTIRMLEMIETVGACVQRTEDRACLLRHAEMIVRGGREGLAEEEDRRTVESRFADACRQLDCTAQGKQNSLLGETS